MNGSNPTFDDIAVRDRTPAAIRADNLIRQRLRIGDPRDPREVAEGLKRLFPKDAGLLAAEAEGFAVVPYRSRTMPRVPESMATGAELNQAIADIDRDLARADRRSSPQGHLGRAAGLGPGHPLDRRRWCGGCAPGARSAGARPPVRRPPAALRLLAARPAHRRPDANHEPVLSAPRAKPRRGRRPVAGARRRGPGRRRPRRGPIPPVGPRQRAAGTPRRRPSGAPRRSPARPSRPMATTNGRGAFMACAKCCVQIEASGHLDLRALLEEPVLGRLMDELIERASQHNVLGLRALGATADLAVQRLHRLLHLIDDRVQPESPAGDHLPQGHPAVPRRLPLEPQRLPPALRRAGADRLLRPCRHRRAGRRDPPPDRARRAARTPRRAARLLSWLRLLRRRRDLPDPARQDPLRHRPRDRPLHARQRPRRRRRAGVAGGGVRGADHPVPQRQSARRQQRLPRRRMLPPSQRAHRHSRADPRPSGFQ